MKGRGPSLREEDDSWRTLLHAAGHSFMNWSNGETMNCRFPPFTSLLEAVCLLLMITQLLAIFTFGHKSLPG
jgi:hypothetical protein